MANTVMTAKNTFAEGLIMDFSPDNTQASCMTSALNATVLTFNGNEMSLQNDMGNGRVETAYLPEGYVPVGTCEFGDIIYIVSYNPIINKSQIGCFPSPERNISSDEVGGLEQSLKWTDFQGSNGSGPNGEIVASSVKKILYGTKDMTSGDKYIIYSTSLDSAGNYEYLSDYRNTSHQHERFPKLVKIHVVSIEESGKITYLDSSTKWYKENDFYICNSRKIVDKPDLDSYRTMVSSAYSIFSSKVSGKLALLIELEKISGFSCTWSAYTKEINNNPDLQQNEYSIYWNFSWNTEDNNINPNAVVLTQSKWTGENDIYAGKYQIWEKDEDRDGWVLGGKSNNWIPGPSIPVAYPDYGYSCQSISRVYKPESYRGSFQNFINSDSYEAQSKSILSSIKLNDSMPNVELIKVNLARKSDGTPDVGKYYFNCSSSSSEKGVVAYYTNYNNKLVKVDPNTMSDDIINNKFNYPIVKHFADFTIPVKQRIQDNEWKDVNINNLIYYYELTPAMPYGLLREFSQDGYIDFKKIGTKSIKLNSWRYYNYENTSTLTWGLEAYTEPNKGISEVVFLFYDNQEKPAAAYHNSGKISYNGKFTEYFTLNTSGTNYKLNNKDESNKPFYHKGQKVSKEDVTISNTYLDKDGNVISIKDMEDGVDYYLNDAGTLYSNCLYLVKIIVKYCNIGVLDEYINDTTSYIEDYRWYWTNTMFNEYYQSVLDFKDLQLSLNLDSQAMFETIKEKWEIKRASYGPKFNYTESINSSNIYKSLSSNVQYINQDDSCSRTGNVRMAIRAGLQNDYNTFNIRKESIRNINARIFLAKEYISNNPEQPSVIFSKTETTSSPIIFPTTANRLTGKVDSTTSKLFNELVGSPILGTGKEIYDSENAYEKYTNNFHLEPVNSSTKTGNYNGKLSYIDSNGEQIEISDFTEYSVSLDQIIYDEENGKIDTSKAFPMTLSGIYHSKYYYTTEPKEQSRTLRSFVVNTEDLEYYALRVNSGTNTIQFKYMLLMALGNRNSGDETSTMISGSVVEFDKNVCTGIVETLTPINCNGDTSTNKGGDKSIKIQLFLSYNSDKIGNKLHFLFPIGFGYNYMGDSGDIKEALRGSNNGPSLATPKKIQTGSYTNDNLAGTLGGITTSGVIEPGDQYTKQGWGTSKNALTAFTSVVLGYLTQFFYLGSSTYTIQAPNNIIYLDSNNLYYNRDVVVELSVKEGTDMSSLLTFRQSWNYQSYVSSIINHFSGVSHEQVSKLANNVCPIIYSSLKTSPLQFKFTYEIPELHLDLNLGTRTQSIYDEIPEYTNKELQPDTIYYWNKETKAFDHFSNTNKIYDSNYTIEDSKIKGTMSDTNYYVVNEVVPVLQLTGNRLSLSSIPSNFSGTYKVLTWNGDDYMEDFKTNLKYYRNK